MSVPGLFDTSITAHNVGTTTSATKSADSTKKPTFGTSIGFPLVDENTISPESERHHFAPKRAMEPIAFWRGPTDMRCLAALVVMIALAATASACNKHASATSVPVAHCQLDGSALVSGDSRDDKQCASLVWKLTRTTASSSRVIHLAWVGNCFDIKARPISRQTTASVTIAVTVLEPDPLPNIGCPATVGHGTVALSRALGTRQLLHARVTQ